MAKYITLPVTVNPITLLGRAYAYLQNLMPSWQPAEGNLDVWLLESSTTEIAELAAILSAVPDIIFRYFGTSLMQLPPTTEASAYGHTTWTFIDDHGHTIPSGTQVGIRNSVGELIPFVTVNDLTVDSGLTGTDPGAVTITALQAGIRGNDLSGSVQLLDILDFVDTVVTSDVTIGGIDSETDEHYMDRLVNTLQLLTLTPILPDDFAILARSVEPIYRATVLDCYNPVDDTFNNPRMVTVVGVDINGEQADTATKTKMKNLLQSVREVNFVVNTMDPTYTTIDVTTTVKAMPDVDHPSLQASVLSAIQRFLSPANWGVPTQGTSNDPRDWLNTNILRKYDLSQAIHAVTGVQTIVPPLLLGISGGTLAESDVTLNGRVSLPRAGTITVTVV